MCISLSLYIYIYTCIVIHTYVCVRIYTYIYIYTYMYTQIPHELQPLRDPLRVEVGGRLGRAQPGRNNDGSNNSDYE